MPFTSYDWLELHVIWVKMSDVISASSSTFPTLLLQNTVLKMTWGFQPSQSVGIRWLADTARWHYTNAEITYLLSGWFKMVALTLKILSGCFSVYQTQKYPILLLGRPFSNILVSVREENFICPGARLISVSIIISVDDFVSWYFIYVFIFHVIETSFPNLCVL